MQFQLLLGNLFAKIEKPSNKRRTFNFQRRIWSRFAGYFKIDPSAFGRDDGGKFKYANSPKSSRAFLSYAFAASVSFLNRPRWMHFLLREI